MNKFFLMLMLLCISLLSYSQKAILKKDGKVYTDIDDYYAEINSVIMEESEVFITEDLHWVDGYKFVLNGKTYFADKVFLINSEKLDEHLTKVENTSGLDPSSRPKSIDPSSRPKSIVLKSDNQFDNVENVYKEITDYEFDLASLDTLSLAELDSLYNEERYLLVKFDKSYGGYVYSDGGSASEYNHAVHLEIIRRRGSSGGRKLPKEADKLNNYEYFLVSSKSKYSNNFKVKTKDTIGFISEKYFYSYNKLTDAGRKMRDWANLNKEIYSAIENKLQELRGLENIEEWRNALAEEEKWRNGVKSLTLGLSKNQVIAKIGEKYRYSIYTYKRTYGNFEVWYYFRDVKITFKDGKLHRLDHHFQ